MNGRYCNKNTEEAYEAGCLRRQYTPNAAHVWRMLPLTSIHSKCGTRVRQAASDVNTLQMRHMCEAGCLWRQYTPNAAHVWGRVPLTSIHSKCGTRVIQATLSVGFETWVRSFYLNSHCSGRDKCNLSSILLNNELYLILKSSRCMEFDVFITYSET